MFVVGFCCSVTLAAKGVLTLKPIPKADGKKEQKDGYCALSLSFS